MIRRRPVPPATPPPPDPPKGVCICACERCTDRPAKDVTRCICPACNTKACGARRGVRSFGDGIAPAGAAG